ncbi:MAG: hypothetical protein QF489_05155 [Planctomycetota bacterium]|jgi:hypothetical protein|nr:hypothetical protein [Planctomycetota bacterium]
MRLTSSTFFIVAAPLLVVFALQAAAVPNSSANGAVPLRQPIWDSIRFEENTETQLLAVPEGLRFVLTDLWFLSYEDEIIKISPNDRLWIESRIERDRRVVFDSPMGELPYPLRWETGVSFTSGREVWMHYRSSPVNECNRRIFFSGYFEADVRAPRY